MVIPLKVAAVHLTLACNLACVGCNRGCFIRPPHTPRMTLDKFGEFLDEIQTEDIHLSHLRLLGGEPTLHPDFMKFVGMAAKYRWKSNRKCRVQVLSNQYSEHSLALLDEVRQKYTGVKILAGAKQDGSVEFGKSKYIFVSSEDAGVERTPGCHWLEGVTDCGFCVDQLGYAICAPGGTIDSLLQLNARAQYVKQLQDPDFCKWQMDVLCKHCGGGIVYENLPELHQHRGTPVSAMWNEAILAHIARKSPKAST